MLQVEFWISELADRTGVSTRTIRYYIEEGLLPQPEIRGKYAIFTEDYLHRLELIKALKDSYLPLREIKDLLSELNEGEIKGLLEDMQADPVAALSRLKALPVFSRETRDFQVKENALDYISSLRGRKISSPPASPLPNAHPDFLMAAPPQPQKEEWQRIELAPGIELHVRLPLTSRQQRLIDKMIEYFQNQSNP